MPVSTNVGLTIHAEILKSSHAWLKLFSVGAMVAQLAELVELAEW